MDASGEEALLMFLINKQINRKKRQNRRFWTHEIVQSRMEAGLFANLYQELRNDDDKFFDFLRMSIASFDELLGLLKEKIRKKDTVMRSCITPEERLAMTLRYLATGCSLADLHFTFRVGKSTASTILREVTSCIWSVLAEKEIPPLDQEAFQEIAKGFKETTDFPHCIGAIDGKHIRMVQPNNSGTLFYNYKNFFSIVLLAMCDSDYKFTFIDVGSYGKSSDSGIFKNSELYAKLRNRSLDIPAPTQLGEEILPYVILGDEGFAMSENLLRPYGGKCLSEEK